MLDLHLCGRVAAHVAKAGDNSSSLSLSRRLMVTLYHCASGRIGGVRTIIAAGVCQW